MARVEALVFDVDGTLADTEQDGHRVAFNLAFAELGLPWQWDAALYDVLLEVAGGKERLAHFLATSHPPVPSGVEPGELVAAIHAVKTRHFTGLVAEGRVALRPGVLRLITEARAAGLALGIATTTTPANVTALLGSLAGAFAVIGAGDVVPAKKPAPDIYRWTVERLGVPADRCVAFEDSAQGFQAAMAAGVPTVVTPCRPGRAGPFPGALAVLSDLGEPDAPFTRLDRPGRGHVTVELLEAWRA